VIAMAEVTMSLEEYMQLLRMAGVSHAGSARVIGEAEVVGGKVRSKPKRVGTPNPKMARALKKANSQLRTKSGKLRKGVSQGDVMRRAHALRRKM